MDDIFNSTQQITFLLGDQPGSCFYSLIEEEIKIHHWIYFFIPQCLIVNYIGKSSYEIFSQLCRDLISI